MTKPDHLPPSLRDVIADPESGVIVLESDLTESGHFGSSFLALTEGHLYAAAPTRVLAAYPLSTIREVTLDQLAGGGRLVARTDEGFVHLIQFSKHLVPHFSAMSRLITARLHQTPIEPAAELHRGFCPRCRTPLPDRDTTCPKCTSRLGTLLRILALTAPYRSRVTALVIVATLGVGLQILPPYLTKRIIDDVVGGGEQSRLLSYILAMGAAGVGYFLLRLVNIRLTAWIGARIVGDLRSRIYTALQYIRLSFFRQREAGEIVGRIMHDSNELLQFLIEGMPFLIVNILSCLAIGVILIVLDWRLAVLVYLPAPFFAFGSAWFWERLTPLFHRQGSSIGRMHSVLSESLHGLKAVKACAQERRRIDQFEKVNQHLSDTHVKVNRIFGSFNETMFWVMSLVVTLVWYLSARRITDRVPSLTLGELLAFVGYIWLFYGPLQWFSVVLNWMTHAFCGAERIFEVIDSQQEMRDPAKAVVLPVIKGAIEFRNVRFGYERGTDVIRGMSFTIREGEVVGLVGRSGAGKSTIINLLTRFYDPDSGEILVDGAPINGIRLDQLRTSMGIVMQDPFLFNASIAENIAFGSEHAPFREIVEAAKAAHAHDFIMRKSDGYDTMLGDGGESLSGGEKQRIAIARAVLHNPPILILDEATSSVDAVTERAIQEALARLVKGRTTIAIAHRLSTLRIADRLMVIEAGTVSEVGSHDELVARGGTYARMAASYAQASALQSVVWGPDQ